MSADISHERMVRNALEASARRVIYAPDFDRDRPLTDDEEDALDHWATKAELRQAEKEGR